jgi:hypothetical protein
MSVPSGTTGVFCLGRTRDRVCAVVRADHNLPQQIKSYHGRYTFFWFETADTTEAGWIVHCRAYHRHLTVGSLDDASHPAPPTGTSMSCVVCGRSGKRFAREVGIGLGPALPGAAGA